MFSFILIIVCAFFFPGIINRTRSIVSGRKGPKILQPVHNIALLLRKGSVFSTSSSIITQFAPIVYIASTVVAALLVPFGNYSALISFDGDFIVFVYLLALGRIALILEAMDAASSFEGMGASREALYSMLVEPAFFILMGAFALITGYTSFEAVFTYFQTGGLNGTVLGILAAFVLFGIMIVETCRVPVDDPRTHLELTMIHEVMILDNSGFDLGLIHITIYLKFTIFSALIAACLIPTEIGFVWYLSLYFIIEIACAIVIGFLESFRARYRLPRNPSYMITITAMAFVALITAAVM
ncbi:MAG: NADH-quinone oxidoreductase subunit H [Prevotellaceae bacterium]|jgi:formate hydrogenlyase subunit 4|nr:NADH-quinone oxidoreductase subunit H [Prevotellaceae bacterium]